LYLVMTEIHFKSNANIVLNFYQSIERKGPSTQSLFKEP